jgi:hypothetical protein
MNAPEVGRGKVRNTLTEKNHENVFNLFAVVCSALHSIHQLSAVYDNAVHLALV